MTRSDLARPVVAEPHALQLVAHRRDVLARPVGGMHLGVDCRILRRQSERVPTHRMQNIEALCAAVAGDQIANRVVPHMPDMQLAGRVWKHFKNIIFRAPGIRRDLEQPLLAPDALPFCFAFAEVVSRHSVGSGHVGPEAGCNPVIPACAALFSTRRSRRPRALQLPRSAEDRVFEIGLDLPRDGSLGPLSVRRTLLAINRHGQRIGMQRPGQDEDIDPVA